MKIIRLSTEGEVSLHEFPKGDYYQRSQFLHDLIGNGCNILEAVYPERLYTVLKCERVVTDQPGTAVLMLVDEEGHYRNCVKENPIGEYLYATDRHGIPIVGNALIIGSSLIDGDADFSGINDDVLERLEPQLRMISKTLRGPGPEKGNPPKPISPKI